MQKRILFPFSLVCLIASLQGSPVHAQQFSEEYNSCVSRAHGTVQQEMCAETELGKQDARLNKAYQQLMHQYSGAPEKQVALRAEERTWLKKRDYDCNMGRNVVDEGCVMTKTATRADALEQQVKF